MILGIACLSAPSVSSAAIPVKLSGAITGMVKDASGTPRMGATVVLYNRLDRICEKTLTDDRGEFRFLSLFPETYSIRVTLASFFPALQRNIQVQPGTRSVLAVNLSTLFSSIHLAYPPIEDGSLMTEDWKWVLRGSGATRPILRLAGEESRPARPGRGSVISEMRGVLRVSAGDGPPNSGIASEADLGTAFALAASLYGNSLVEVSGNLGFGSQTGVPSAAFRTSYSRRTGGFGPEVSVTMRQMYFPGRMAAAVTGAERGAPALRTLSASFDDRTLILDGLVMQYGLSMDSVSYLERLSYLSPYARLSYTARDGSEIAFAYTSGNARPDLAQSASDGRELQRDLASLGMFPRITRRGHAARIQRGQEYELTYTRKAGSRTYQLAAYREAVANAALSMVAPAGMYDGTDVLPDLFSGNSIFNAGDYHSTGFTAAITQAFGGNVSATLMYGSMGALTADDEEIRTNDPDELRSVIRMARKRAATARLDATVPQSGTQLAASYQWTDHRWAMPGHIYTTQSVRPMPGLNFHVRQPMPGRSLPWRMELTADLRNMLAQGYLALNTADGQRILLVQTPRTVRGGLNFIF